MQSLAELPNGYGHCEHFRPKDGIDEISNPIQAAMDISKGFRLMSQCYSHINQNSTAHDFHSIHRWYEDLAYFNYGTRYDALILFALACIWTIARQILVTRYFKVSE